jgi:hypothetical protein
MSLARAIALVALLVLAGCTGAGPLADDAPAADTTTLNDTAASNGTPSLVDEDAVSTTTTVAAGDVATPPGMNGSSVENVSRLLEAHFSRLQAVANYTLVLDRQGREYTTVAELAVTNREQRVSGSAESRQRATEIYYANGTRYIRTDAGEVQSSAVPFDRVTGSGAGFLNALGGTVLERENVTTVAGRTVLTYRITDITDEVDGGETIDDVQGHLQVTPDGLITELRFEITGPNGTAYPQRYAIESIDATTTNAPSWFENVDTGSATPVNAPQITFEFTEREDGRVEVSHYGGDAAETLSVRYTADGELQTETWDPEEQITAGTTYVTELAADSGTTLRVVWTGDSGEQSVVIAEHEVGG